MDVPRQFVFAGSSEGEPWWTLGEVTARILAPRGFQVTVEGRSASTENPRWIGRGDALIGACVPRTVLWASQGRYQYEGETFPDFRAIARVTRPSWIAVAATAESRITSLAQVKAQQIPVRILTGNWEGVASVVPKKILAYYDLSREEIEGWGGKFHRITGQYGAYIREHDVDVIINSIYLGFSPVMRYWIEAATLLNLRFLTLDDGLLEKLVADGHGTRGEIPRRLVRGLTHDIPSVYHPEIIIYGRGDLPEEFAYDLARAYDEGRDAFIQTAIHMVYDPRTVADTTIPLHPGAARYYREKGYIQ